MGGIAGAAGSIGSSAISAAAAMQMQSQMLDNYWQQIERQAEIFRDTAAHRALQYDNNYRQHRQEFVQQRERAEQRYEEQLALHRRTQDQVLEQIKAPQSDIYGGQRRYSEGLGHTYSMAPHIQEAFNQSIANQLEQNMMGNRIQQEVLPNELARYAGRERYTPDELFQTYFSDANLADWRARQEMGERLALASVRGGNRSNWADSVSDYLREDSRDRQLRFNEARRNSYSDSIALNQASDAQAYNNLRQTLDLAGLGQSGLQFGQFGDAKQSNLSGIEGALLGAIGNVSGESNALGNLAQNRRPWAMNQSHSLKMAGDYEQPPSLSV